MTLPSNAETAIGLPPVRESRPLLAALWMLGAVTCFSLMAIAGRAVSSNLDTFEIMAYRSLIGIVLVSAFISATGRWGEIKSTHFGTHVMRNLAHFTGQNLWFYAITVVPLAQVFALEFTTPLWVLLMAPLLLGEKITPIRAFAALLGFAGILVVAQPGAAPLSPGLLAAAACAIGFSLTYIFMKRLTAVATTACIMFWLVVMQAVFGLVCAGIDGDMALPDAANLPWVIVIAAGGLIAHTCIATALRLAPATLVAPFDFIRLPLIATIGWLFYAEPVSLALIVGAGLILSANWLNLWASTRKVAA